MLYKSLVRQNFVGSDKNLNSVRPMSTALALVKYESPILMVLLSWLRLKFLDMWVK